LLYIIVLTILIDFAMIALTSSNEMGFLLFIEFLVCLIFIGIIWASNLNILWSLAEKLDQDFIVNQNFTTSLSAYNACKKYKTLLNQYEIIFSPLIFFSTILWLLVLPVINPGIEVNTLSFQLILIFGGLLFLFNVTYPTRTLHIRL